MLAFPSNHYKEKIRGRKSTPKLSAYNISTPGKYIITDSKIRNGNWIILIIIIVGGVVLIVGIGVYIGLKKQYWFW